MGFSGCLICLSKSTDRVQAPFQVIPRRKSFRQACVKRSLFAPHQPEARGDRASLATGKPQKVGSVNIVDHGVRIGVTGDIDSGQPSCPLVAAEPEAFLDPQIEAQVVGESQAIGGTDELLLLVNNAEGESVRHQNFLMRGLLGLDTLGGRNDLDFFMDLEFVAQGKRELVYTFVKLNPLVGKTKETRLVQTHAIAADAQGSERKVARDIRVSCLPLPIGRSDDDFNTCSRHAILIHDSSQKLRCRQRSLGCGR